MQLVDRLTFGPFGMEMPSWVFYDCAVMPGAVFGLAMRAANLEPWAKGALKVPDGYDGLVPLSQFIAIPVLAGFQPDIAIPVPSTIAHADAAPESWLLYTLESLNQVSPGIAPAGLLPLTLALGLEVFPIRELYGITQWRSPKLMPYADLGPLELTSAYTPAHSLPRTLSFRVRPTPQSIRNLLTWSPTLPDAPRPTLLLDVDDLGQLIDVQRRIEQGERIHLVGHPTRHGPTVIAPLWSAP
jgi:hypothetical protein